MIYNILYRFLCLGTALLLCFFLQGQLLANDVLAHKISVSFYQTPLAEALRQVADKGQFEWSYNANILQPDKRVTLFAQSETVREILHQMLGGEYSFKQSGEYLILKKVKKPQQKVSGYLTDKNTGQKVPNATIYDRQTLKSTTTDENGYYELPVTPRSEIVVSKLAYRDTILQVTSQSPRFIKISIKLDSVAPQDSKDDSWASIQRDLARVPSDIGHFFNISAQKLTELNVHDDTLNRRFQISLLPNIGTNYKMSGSVTNDISINLLAGYSNGNRVAEIGGLGNITSGNIAGVQVGGVFNEVNGAVNGVQVAGAYNNAGGKLTGVQVSGGINIARQSASNGVQVSGFANWVPRGDFAVQVAGFANVADTANAVQVAGFTNYTHTLKGVQVGGFSNFARQAKAPAQVAGFYNFAQKGLIDAQVAGFANIADSIAGVQVAGFINRAQKVKGAQIGVINFAREIDGVQLGILNFSRRGGYIVLEASANEVHYTNLTFKTGTPFFYTIFTAGISPMEGANLETDGLWSCGAGIGAYAFSKRRVGLTLDLVHRHISQGQFDAKLQEWEQITPSINIKLGKKFSAAWGPSANLLIAADKNLQEKVVPDNFPMFSFGNHDRLRWWIGGQVALRFKF